MFSKHCGSFWHRIFYVPCSNWLPHGHLHTAFYNVLLTFLEFDSKRDSAETTQNSFSELNTYTVHTFMAMKSLGLN